jgi:uncharacterized protein DUF4157
LNENQHTSKQQQTSAATVNKSGANGNTMPAVPVIQQKESEATASDLSFAGSGFQTNTLQQYSVPALQRKTNTTGMPDHLKAGVENLSGMDLSDVKVHYNSSQPAQLNALAYAQGNEIHIGTGQEQHLAHEAWHVVQQRQGRVQATKQMKQGVAVNDDAGLEHEADVMGAMALQQSATGMVMQQVAQYRYHNLACGCNTCGPTQLKEVSQLLSAYNAAAGNTVFQLKTKISIMDNTGATVEGQSSNPGYTESMLAKWPVLSDNFSAHVHEQEVDTVDENGKPNGKMIRGNYSCAEPHAYASILNRYDNKDQVTVTRAWLDTLRFPALAEDDKGNKLKPCPVCAQWVTSAAPLALLDNVKSVNPIKNRAMIAEEKRVADEAERQVQEQAKYEENLEAFKGASDISFDGSGNLKGRLQTKLSYYESLKKNVGKNKPITAGAVKPSHAKAWEGIIHAHSAPDFVTDAIRLDKTMLDNLKVEKADRGASGVEDPKAIAAMEEYYTLCDKQIKALEEDPGPKLIIDLVKSLLDTDQLDGDIENISRHIALKALPRKYDQASVYVEINEDGTVEINDVDGE